MSTTETQILEALEPLCAEPETSAVLTDVDGTLAPIVDRPGEAEVPPETAEVLRELQKRYALVACVTGRRALEARAMVGVDEITYVGNQGFEVLGPGADEPIPDPAAATRSGAAAEYLAELDWDRLDQAGLRQEDKGPIQVVHWRGAPDEAEAEREVARIAEGARARDLIPLWGRKVLDLRPVAGIDKGSSVHRLLVDNAPLRAAIFAGDDTTDLDAFRSMSRLAGTDRLGVAVRVGVVSPESPPEIEAEADITVTGTDGVLKILKALAG
ncbi:trehalose-phosphatase [soil metagenome]